MLKSFQFLMKRGSIYQPKYLIPRLKNTVTGTMKPNICLVLYKENIENSNKKRTHFLGEKMCSVARGHTDTHKHTHESEYRYPFKVSGIFPSTYQQGSVQLKYIKM